MLFCLEIWLLNYIFNILNTTFWTHAHKAGATLSKVSKVAKIRNRYNQVPHLTQDTNGKVTNSQKTPLRTILSIQQKVAPVFTSPNGINFKVSKSAKIRNRYKQVPHMTYRHKGIQTFQWNESWLLDRYLPVTFSQI